MPSSRLEKWKNASHTESKLSLEGYILFWLVNKEIASYGQNEKKNKTIEAQTRTVSPGSSV